MKTFLVQIGIELAIQFLRQVVDSGAVGEMLDRAEAKIRETESRVDDVLVLPFLRSSRIVLSERKEEIAVEIGRASWRERV